MTSYAEVIGDPIAQSKSPAIHGFWIEKLGLEAAYRAHHVTSETLAAYLSERREDPDWRGCNVTMPHKQAVAPLVDRIEPLAKRVGAINTVYRGADGALIGRNTDVAGFLEPLVERLRDQQVEGPEQAERRIDGDRRAGLRNRARVRCRDALRVVNDLKLRREILARPD